MNLPDMSQFWDVSTPREARARLHAALRLELLGPWEPDEALSESPITRYATGMLPPFGTEVPPQEHDEGMTAGGDDEEAGAVDEGPPLSHALTPSSIGLSFLVPADSRDLSVALSWGEYRREDVPQAEPETPTEEPAGSVLAKEPAGSPSARRRPQSRWIRTPYEPSPLRIELRPEGAPRR